jgi:DNA-binding response OmpR family regulator
MPSGGTFLLRRTARSTRSRSSPDSSINTLTAPGRCGRARPRVTVDERPVELSAVEYRLLCHLVGEPIRVLTKVNFE